MMVISAFAFSSLSPAAFAAQIVCSGSYYGYDFTVNAKTSKGQVYGSIKLIVSQNGSVVKEETLATTGSDIRPGALLNFAGQSQDGSGVINASFANGQYSGNLDAQTSQGDFTMAVTCTMEGTP